MSVTLIVGLVGMTYAAMALAHCFPDHSTPAPGSALNASPTELTVHFDNPFDPTSTSVRVLNGNGDIVSETGRPDSTDQSLTVPLKELAPGQYFVKWRALSKDGDRTMGAYSFTVMGATH